MTPATSEPLHEGRVLSIAGLDPSGGAGLLADIKTISMHNCYGAGVATAQTVQNTCGVSHVEPVDLSLISKQIKAVLDDMEIEAIKIGMLHNEKIIEQIATDLSSRDQNYIIIIDPIIKSSSGAELLSVRGVNAMVERLFPLTTVLTPNIPEAEVLADMKIKTKQDMLKAATLIKKMGVENVLLTGGHLSGDKVVDVLLTSAREVYFESEKLHTKNDHGTGCALSTSIACLLSQGFELAVAVEQAKKYVFEAIKNSKNIGKGNGPINHIFANEK